jgi:hypothetical protein
MTEFRTLLNHCGLSLRGCCRLLDVRYDTLKSWYYGRNKTPEGVIDVMKEYAKAADEIFGERDV